MSANSSCRDVLDYRYLTPQLQSPNQNSTFCVLDDSNSSPTANRSLESQKLLDRISTFSSNENLPQRVAFLEQELSIYGYPPIKATANQEQDSSDGVVDLVNLVNISYDLLNLWRRTNEARNDASDLQRTSDSEIIRLRHVASRLREDIAGKEHDLKTKDLLHHQLKQRVEDLKKKLKSEQEKTRRLTSEMTARDVQFKHDKKKKMQEIDKLQTRLQQLLQDKRQERMLGIEILNSLQRSDGRRGKWHNDHTKKTNEQDMYRLIINNYEDSQRQLLKENEGMRQCLKDMQDELISALNERGTPDQTGVSAANNPVNGDNHQGSNVSSDAASCASENSEEPMSDGMFEMPYDLVKEDIERSIRGKWRTLKREIRRSRRAGKAQPGQAKMNDEAYEDLMTQQQELIHYLTSANDNGGRPVPADSYFLEEKAELDNQRKNFLQTKQAFDKDRQLYAEALIQLEERRRAFEFEKSQWYHKNFMLLTPFRNSKHSDERLRKASSPRQESESQHRPSHSLSSESPDRGKFSSPNYRLTLGAPDALNQSLIRIHSANQHNAFYPDFTARPAWQSPPEHTNNAYPRKTKSTPANTMTQPSTAELYRVLGLTYQGSDKENENSSDVGNGSSSQVCPRSSGTSNLRAAGPYRDSNIPAWRRRKRTRSKSRPVRNIKSLADDDDNSGLNSDFDQSYSTNRSFIDNKNNRLRFTPRTGRDITKWRSVSDMDDFAFSLPGDNMRFISKTETRPRSYSTPSTSSPSSQGFVSAKTSFDDLALPSCKAVHIKNEFPAENKSGAGKSNGSVSYRSQKSRKSTLKQFVKSILSPKRLQCSPVPSAGTILRPCSDFKKSLDHFDGSSNNVTCFPQFGLDSQLQYADVSPNGLQKTNLRVHQSPCGYSTPGGDLFDISTPQSSNSDVRLQGRGANLSPSYSMPTLVSGLKHRVKSRRSNSIEIATLQGSVDRHKAALFSMCCKLKPAQARFDAGEEDCAFDADETAASFDSCDYMEKLSQLQYSDSIYDQWTHTNSTGSVRNGILF